MSILLWIILGVITGWMADVISRSNNDIVTDIILGIIGAFIGGFIMIAFGQPSMGFHFPSLILAVIGATALIGISRLFHKSQREGHLF